MVMLFILIILPIMVLFANDNVFFVIIAVIMLVFSIKNLHRLILKHGQLDEDEDLSVLSEYSEDMSEIDMKKFGLIAKTTKNLIIMLFYIYCIFQLKSLAAKAFLILIILYWLYITINGTQSTLPISIMAIRSEKGAEAAGPSESSANAPMTEASQSNDSFSLSFSNIFYLLINLATIIIIILTACNKFIRKVI